jgi:hypothetical protein
VNPQTVRLVGGPFDGQERTVWTLAQVFTVPISYRRQNETTFVWCPTQTAIGEDDWRNEIGSFEPIDH